MNVGRPAVVRPRAGHHERHTPEAEWRQWAGWERLPLLSPPGAGDRVVVLAAHPDDDVLAAGGLLVRLAERGCELLFVCATDGESSHPGSPTIEAAALAERRIRELDAALVALGHANSERLRLHLPDAALTAHEGELAGRLVPHLKQATVLLAPWSEDGHPDHDAAGRAARRAVDQVTELHYAGGGASKPPALWEYPVWAWHWAEPADHRLPWERARTVRLHPHEQVAKQAAVACFVSQLYPLSPDPSDQVVLPPQVLAHFTRPYETVLV